MVNNTVGGIGGVDITNFWSIVLDDHWSKTIYRPKMIVWSDANIHPCSLFSSFPSKYSLRVDHFCVLRVFRYVSYQRARYACFVVICLKKCIKFVFVVCLGSGLSLISEPGRRHPTITTLASRANRANRGRRGGKVNPSCKLPATRGISQRPSRDDPDND